MITGSNFVVIDVETSNPSPASICQIGIAKVKDGLIVAEWESLINPDDYFDSYNIHIHGIDESDVEDAPMLADIWDDILDFIGDLHVVCYSKFDRTAFNRSSEIFGINISGIEWVDATSIVRRVWPQFQRKGYGLKNASSFLGLTMDRHHNALSDAISAANIVITAITKSGLSFDYWASEVKKPLKLVGPNKCDPKDITLPSASATLLGEVVVFTGTLSQPRSYFEGIVAAAGGDIRSSVTKATTLVVVGEQDLVRTKGAMKSLKQVKAEQLSSEGVAIRIMDESGLLSLI